MNTLNRISHAKVIEDQRLIAVYEMLTGIDPASIRLMLMKECPSYWTLPKEDYLKAENPKTVKFTYTYGISLPSDKTTKRQIRIETL